MQIPHRSSTNTITVHIGLDDTDSTGGRCTTHTAYRIAEYLLKHNAVEFTDYPLLVRLNPNIPWKTRGNAAVCLRFRTEDHVDMLDRVIDTVRKQKLVAPKANPGFACYCGESIPHAIQDFAHKTLYDVMSRKMAEKLAKDHSIHFTTEGNGQGLVGSIAAIGTLLQGDHTFEAIAYRKQENCGKPRELDHSQVVQYDKETFPYTFNNYDGVHRRVLILPHGPDPVFCGIRGEASEVVVSALKRLQICEELEGYMVFRTNQGTNLHLQRERGFADLKCYTAGFCYCEVYSKPIVIEGGHAIFSARDHAGTVIKAAIYEPTGLANVASRLDVGDVIKIGFGVRKPTSKHPRILNIEYLQVLAIKKTFEPVNPSCLVCNKRMKSEGMNKGFRCHKCGLRNRNAKKILIPKPRTIATGLFIPTPKAHRHLTKPIHRYGMEKTLGSSMSEMLRDWFSRGPSL